MPNGKPSDHLITDVMIHNRVVFGAPGTASFGEIVDLLGYERAHEWFNAEYRSKLEAEVRRAISRKLIALRKEALDRGWEKTVLARRPADVNGPRFGGMTARQRPGG